MNRNDLELILVPILPYLLITRQENKRRNSRRRLCGRTTAKRTPITFTVANEWSPSWAMGVSFNTKIFQCIPYQNWKIVVYIQLRPHLSLGMNWTEEDNWSFLTSPRRTHVPTWAAPVYSVNTSSLFVISCYSLPPASVYLFLIHFVFQLVIKCIILATNSLLLGPINSCGIYDNSLIRLVSQRKQHQQRFGDATKIA